jgi:hypothetical protein
MDYKKARLQEIRSAYDKYIDGFVSKYKKEWETVILLPGGMGSQPDRSTKRYKGTLPMEYDPIWIDGGIVPVFSRNALKLEIEANGNDLREHIVVPNGPLRYLAEPYDGTRNYFANKNINYVVFGYDWRRSLEETAGHLKWFLQRIKQKVTRRRNDPDVLSKTTLLCHSMGGLVAKLFLNQVFPTGGSENLSNWMKRWITVATPFYGTADHMSRYYHGDPLLSGLYSPGLIAPLVGTLPGPYILMMLDKDTFKQHKAGLEIDNYPVIDSKDGSVADPFNPDFGDRFPDWVGENFLDSAKKIRQKIAAPLRADVARNTFHIRSQNNKKTWVGIRWENVDGEHYDPDEDTLPLCGIKGAGDGVVPFWSARLSQTPVERVYDLPSAKNHGILMENDEALRAVDTIINEGRIPIPGEITASRKSHGGPRVSKQKMNQFLEDVKNNSISKDDPRVFDEKIWRRITAEYTFC